MRGQEHLLIFRKQGCFQEKVSQEDKEKLMLIFRESQQRKLLITPCIQTDSKFVKTLQAYPSSAIEIKNNFSVLSNQTL